MVNCWSPVLSPMELFSSFCVPPKISLANWTVPVITQIVCVVLVLASVALYFIPLNYILLVVMTRKFIKKGMWFRSTKGLSIRRRNFSLVPAVDFSICHSFHLFLS